MQKLNRTKTCKIQQSQALIDGNELLKHMDRLHRSSGQCSRCSRQVTAHRPFNLTDRARKTYQDDEQTKMNHNKTHARIIYGYRVPIAGV